MRQRSGDTARRHTRIAPRAGRSHHKEAAVASASAFVVDTTTLPRAKVGGVDDPAVRWAGAFAAYGGHGTTASSTIVYEIEPGGPARWRTGVTAENHYHPS